MPQVSIIIPHYNRAALLAETLDSVRAQTYPHWEVIVVDDQSDAEQWEAIQDYADGDRVRILQRSDDPRGPSHCRNIGLAQAHGEYILFLDSDDLLAPWCLDTRLRALGHPVDGPKGDSTQASDPSIQPSATSPDRPDLAIFPVLLFHEQPGDSDTPWNTLDGDDDLLRFLRSDPPWCVSSPLWQRNALTRIGGFNEAVFYGDDAELHTRAILCGLKYRKYPQARPDCYIRRSDVARITSGLSEQTIASRRIRLAETQRLIDRMDVPEDATLTWQGAYVAEAEFLLFNHPTPKAWVTDILHDMREHAHVAPWRWMAIRLYFTIALATRDRAYILLRLTRKALYAVVPFIWLTRNRVSRTT